MKKRLIGKVCVVTGATRGIGRGVAIALAEEGAIIYVTGRSTGDGALTVESCVKAIEDNGGKGIGVVIDHANDSEIESLFNKISEEQEKIDLLVNNVFKIPDNPVWSGGFWEHPIQAWDDQVGIGLRAHYIASWHAAPLLFKSDESLIMNISSPGGSSYHFSSSYGTGKAGLDRLTADMAVELKEKGVHTISLYPGAVSTEFVLDNAVKTGNPVENAQTPLMVGRTVVALALAEDLKERSGSIQWVEDISREFNVRDEDGNLAAPYPIRNNIKTAD